MTIRVALNHNTHYKFDRLVNLSAHVVRLRPAAHCRTPIHSYSLKVTPETHFINWQQDAFGNYLARLVFPEKTDHFSIEVEVLADMTVINPFDFFLEEYAEEFPFSYEKQLEKELAPYLEKQQHGELFSQVLEAVPETKQRTIDFLVAANQVVQTKIAYSVRMEPGVQTPEDTLKLAVGSCRDSAWLLVQMLRHLGLAARFTSGYLVQLTSDEKSLDGPSGPDADFTDLHAWCEVYLPGAGWVGMDPTSGLFAGEGHIPLACTPDPSSAAPIEGATDPCEVTFDFSNTVTRFHEDPRVTKPYTDDQWRNIIALGDQVDEVLKENDVRLTMGGEPTFVSIDDMESDQWNTGALGADKLSLSKTLLLKLRDHFAPQGLIHYGQGKWYPGEEVPRWALGIFWRKDSEPLWRAPELLARIDQDYGHNAETAQVFTTLLTKALDLPEKFAQPAYEDALHYLMQEQQLPEDFELNLVNAKDDLERKRMARLLDKGMSEATGFCLPLQWNSDVNHWQSSSWSFRRGRLTLIPGDSPMGLRLPLGELSMRPDEDYPTDRDPFETREPLKEQKNTQAPNDERAATTAENLVRTSLCIEVRDGKLHVFLPPITHLEEFINLISAIESVATESATPVIIEGYEPPKDPRLQKLLITPDPGVIEVNVHPVKTWREQIENTTELYKLARESRLASEKFMLDGRHTGTGGGNHITLGGPTPADSPILRRPDILRSFVTYWQHHPSLSYLFSSAFVGPTSQAPRVDEGRDEILYELEIAFDQMPDGLTDKPWLVDRIMRNLLIDITGNTHRAEFCIDKLYAPGSATGRLGILEFRGFEMPPHSRMALLQALLIRSLVARFWQEPYKKPLVRWGTQLHDKFMLPHFVWQDIREVVQDLQDHGFPFELNWLLPFQEFRFPNYGRVMINGIEIELNWAIEPWHVLGEEIGSFGTARYVDSSVERLQVKVNGMTEGRYLLVCNGRRVPLVSTGKQGEHVAGVRYRAWAPPSALHPTMGVHTPLHFDLIDTWNGRSIGGCSYYVSHPGGRSYDNFPVNAFEAESRRISRFSDTEHTQGTNPGTPPPEEAPDEYPNTLDLRRDRKN
ncbi:MAG: hypothetical protein ACI82A_003213 [Candidatus Azotimanducaceae bacterium]|jgi:uncharacterized protein (DUF2126 family)/transglutaminase-like putative cysteine protease